MVGFNAELYKTRNISAQKNTLITPSVPTLNTATGEANASGAYNHTAVAGFFARVNWSYKDRYMFEANGRYDGSSRFVGDKRWGFFPSFSAGWNIAREEFFAGMADKIGLGSLKLRASWGNLEIQIPKMPGILFIKVCLLEQIMVGWSTAQSQLCSNAWTCKYPKNLGNN